MKCDSKSQPSHNRVKYYGYSVLMWRAIKGNGSRMLIRCPDTLDCISYQTVLGFGLTSLLDDKSIFMNDGSTCHRSRSTMKYLEEKKFVCLEIGRRNQRNVENLY